MNEQFFAWALLLLQRDPDQVYMKCVTKTDEEAILAIKRLKLERGYTASVAPYRIPILGEWDDDAYKNGLCYVLSVRVTEEMVVPLFVAHTIEEAEEEFTYYPDELTKHEPTVDLVRIVKS